MHRVRWQRAQIGATLRWRPEWPVAVIVVFTWFALVVVHLWPPGALEIGVDASNTPGLTQDHYGSDRHISGAGGTPRLPTVSGEVLRATPAWVLMSVGMMLPIALPALGHIGINSIRSRRLWAMNVYAAAFIGIWLGFGVLVLAAKHWLTQPVGLDGQILLACLLAVASAWQMTPVKRRALFQCRRTTPLPPIGLRADIACVRFALLHGWRCVISCWALMGIMAALGHSGVTVLGAMAGITGIIVTEELTRIGWRSLRVSAGILALVGGIVAVSF